MTELDRLSDVVENMILQHDYPGFEPRGLKLGLPEEIEGYSAKVFSNALGHPSVYVKLAALRWFQERPGMARPHYRALAGLLDNKDEFVRLEAIVTLERAGRIPQEVVFEISKRLKDDDAEVRKAAAKACGKLLKKVSNKDERVVESLRHASQDANSEVRFKAQKALRIIGELAS